MWALVVFLAFGFAFPTQSTRRIVFLSVLFSWTVEFLQLYHTPWIEQIRATLPGRLILGSTYHTQDLLAYLVGIAIGAIAERFFFGSKNRAIPD